MKLREITIKNFRNLVDVKIPIEDTTVLIGENNSGKTALLDALRIALTRTSTSRETPFDEYDYHMFNPGDSPETSEGIVVELWFREDRPNEWPDPLVQALNEIIQMDPTANLNFIGLRVSSRYDETTKEFVSSSQFLALDGQPLRGRGANPSNLARFSTYIRLFYLSAIRDPSEEFSPRSYYWGRILRDLKISAEQRDKLSEELTKLNNALLKADPRLDQVKASLDKVQGIMALETGRNTSIHALPLKPWDLMSRAEVVIKAPGSDIDFPISRHGQGMQSLSVLFLFQAYIDVLLKPTFEPETEAILTLEEPEAHLHPQAVRALAASLSEIKSQMIISSHSPYFIQEIPFLQIRMFRRSGSLSKVLYVKRSFIAKVPEVPKLLEFCENNSTKFIYNKSTKTLTVYGKMDEKERRKLLQMYPGQKDIQEQLNRLCSESQSYFTDSELADLYTYAKRIRGEVFFACAWLLCEGQSEYLLFRYFAELLGKPLDRAGVTVIDFQNNGSPGSFVGLAQTYEIPWIMICDNDEAGKGFAKKILNCGLKDGKPDELIRLLPGEGVDLEMFLINNGFAQEYKQILDKRGVRLAKCQGQAGFEDEMVLKIRENKIGYAIALIDRLRVTPADKSRVPEFLKTVIEDIIAKAR